jgi:hypothetical protein
MAAFSPHGSAWFDLQLHYSIHFTFSIVKIELLIVCFTVSKKTLNE